MLPWALLQNIPLWVRVKLMNFIPSFLTRAHTDFGPPFLLFSSVFLRSDVSSSRNLRLDILQVCCVCKKMGEGGGKI